MRHVLHLLSDSTGETAAAAADAVLSQFDDAAVVRQRHVFVRAPADVDRALRDIGRRPGPVLYTLLDPDLVRRLKDGCAALGVAHVALLEPLFRTMSEEFGAAPAGPRPGRQHRTDARYFERVSAIDYAMAHDDGGRTQAERLRRADVILLGVSRTSKTPTCLYLAVRGVKAANVPLVPERRLPDGLEEAIAAGVPAVGLTVSPTRLVQIRGQRLESIGAPALAAEKGLDYVDPERVRDELAAARLVFERLSLPVIDVTRRSIEETAASILAFVADAPTVGRAPA